MKKPIYKNWWFWVIIVVVIILIIPSGSDANDNKNGNTTTTTTTKQQDGSIEFDNLRLEFGTYTFTKINNEYSEYYGKTIVRLPVTITNLSSETHSLNMFYYSIFGSTGAESDDISFYFDDDVAQAGDLLSGKSYTKYFYFVYDGDGTYTIIFDDMWLEQETIEIEIKK